MAKQKYTNISLPKELMDAIGEFIKTNPGYGFDSRTELIKYTIRSYIFGEKDKKHLKWKTVEYINESAGEKEKPLEKKL